MGQFPRKCPMFYNIMWHHVVKIGRRQQYRAEVSLTFHSLSFVIRLTLEVLTFAQAAECIHKSYDVSAERIIHVLQFSMV